MTIRDILWNREVGSIGGVPIRLDITFVALAAFGVAFTALVLPDGLSAPARWGYAAAATAGVIASYMMHFLAQFLTARRQGLESGTLALSLLAIGVKAPGRPRDPRDMLHCALAGPLASLLLGAPLAAIWFALHNSAGAAVDLIGVVALMNGVLAALGILPAYPMRGAAVVHALCWQRTERELRGLLHAARIGVGVGLAICAFGLVEMLLRFVPVDLEFPLVGLWFAMMGLLCAIWSLYQARFAQRWLWLEEMWPEWNQPDAEPPDPALSAEHLQRRRRR